MPIGVPKVPFQLPEEDEASWVDLYNRLFQERLLFLGQRSHEYKSTCWSNGIFSLEEDRDLYLFIILRAER
ncbi:putative endopeptidase Clp [Medicago truncatula]|uniref:Putative endopeptidase Clp n=1 Tax=Medicago truncatula TaxID=3880 RepID=A0A396IA50_MEDTR|nr:putative endopeptidase Clp [Medicago truncatula]